MTEKLEPECLQFYWHPEYGICVVLILDGKDTYHRITNKQAFTAMGSLAAALSHLEYPKN